MGDSPGASLAGGGGEVSRLVEQAKELQEAAGSLISRTSSEEDALRQRVASLDSRINSLRSSKHDDTVCFCSYLQTHATVSLSFVLIFVIFLFNLQVGG